MKKLLVLIYITYAILTTSAQEPAAHWVATSHDFGAFDEDSGPVSCRFALVNDGPGDIAITSARATCGCTTPSYPTGAIAPGDTAYITATFDPEGRPGRFSKQIYIETSGIPHKSRLDIRGVVIGAGATVARRFPVDMGPLKMPRGGVMMGEVKKGTLKTTYVEGYNQSSNPLDIKITRKPSWLDVVIVPERTEPGEQATFVFYAHTDRCPVYGLVEDSVTIAPVANQEYTIPFTMLVHEDFTKLTPKQIEKAPRACIDETTIDLGAVDRNGAPTTTKFAITNAGGEKLLIRRLYSADEGIDASVRDSAVKSGKSTTATVSVDPSKATGALLSYRLILITNDPIQPERTIRVVGTFK